MESRYGGVARWLTDHGFSDGDLHLLRAKLRAPKELKTPGTAKTRQDAG
jgi:hypothetical protein